MEDIFKQGLQKHEVKVTLVNELNILELDNAKKNSYVDAPVMITILR